MSVTRYRRIIRLCSHIGSFLTTIPAFLFVLAWMDSLPLVWTLLFPFLAVGISFFLQEYCHRLSLFILGNVLCLIAFLPMGLALAGFHIVRLPQTEGLTWMLLPFVYGVFTISLIAINFTRKLRPQETVSDTNFPLVCLIVPILAQIISLSFGLTTPIPWMLACAIFLILLRFLNDYLIGYVAFLEEVRSCAEVPIGQIVSSNSWLLSAFFLLALIIMILSCFVPLTHVFPTVLSILKDLFHAILLVILFLFSWFLKGSSQTDGENAGMDDMPKELGENAVTSPFWIWLENLMKFLLPAIVAVGVLLLLYYGILQMMKTFYNKKTLANDQVEFLNPFDKKEKLGKAPTHQGTFLERLFGTSPEQKIRKLWYKTVSSRLSIVPPEFSPTEQAAEIGQNEAEQTTARQLADFYEKARYSKQACTKEELAQAKQLSKQLSK